MPIRFLPFRCFFFVCTLSLIFSGCAFYDLKKEIEDSEKLYSMAGKVTTPSAPKSPWPSCCIRKKKN